MYGRRLSNRSGDAVMTRATPTVAALSPKPIASKKLASPKMAEPTMFPTASRHMNVSSSVTRYVSARPPKAIRHNKMSEINI